MSKLPTQTLRRVQICSPPSTCTQQTRHASLLKRPIRPYTFTQLVILSDGSTYTQRTTSPQPIFRSTKDTKNHAMWQPSLRSLRNVEEDEAGRLRAFRQRFGRGWDAETVVEGGEESDEFAEDSLMDLISDASSGTMNAQGKESNTETTEEGVKMVTVKKDGVLVKVPAMSRSDRRSKS